MLGTATLYALLFIVIGVMFVINAPIGMDTQSLNDLRLVTPIAVEAHDEVVRNEPRPPRPAGKPGGNEGATVKERVSDDPKEIPVGTHENREGQSPATLPGVTIGKKDYGLQGAGSPFGKEGATGTGNGPATSGSAPVMADEPPPRPAPVVAKKPVRKAPVSGGVMNGKAISLVKPPYPPIARAARAQGTVTVHVLISETGTVLKVTGVEGPPLLREAAVRAAMQSRFTPTLLSQQPVETFGTIVYNFVPN